MKRSRLTRLAALLALFASPALAQSTSVRVLAFSDYHSHALPFRSEGRPGQGGIARAIALLREARRDPHTLIVSGGDMLNKNVPAWSDEFRCVEWPWLDGLLDAMALGNHDLDYGVAAFDGCRGTIRFPILSGNLLLASGAPYLHAGGKPYVVKQVGDVRVGLFALAGPDVQRLIKPADLPPGARWTDALESARSIVKALHEQEHVQAVIFIGHQQRQDDEALARAVPGIDLILGTHSHHKSGLETIAGTSTRTIAPYQYLAYVSDVRLTFTGGRLTRVKGELLPVDSSQPEDAVLAARVAQLDRELRARRPERFVRAGRTQLELSDAGLATGESLIGNWATEVLRQAAGTQVFFSTASSFRGSLPPGDVLAEDFYAAIPYPNTLVVGRLSGAQLAAWLALSLARRGSDGFSQQSGLRYAIRAARVENVQVLELADPGQAQRFVPLDPAGSYLVGTTDFQAFFVEGYKQLFEQAGDVRKTNLDVHTLLLASLEAGATGATARLDGRVRVEP